MALAGLLPAGEPPAIDATTTALASGQEEWLEIPAGPFAMGAPANGFAYDNERPRHQVELRVLPDRAPPGQRRELDALRRGPRL